MLESFVQEVRRELEQHLTTPAADVADMETELRRLEQEEARLIKLAATTDDDPDIAGEVNERRKRIAQLQTQLAAARQTPTLLREKLDAAEAHMRGRLADLAGLLADRGEGGRRLCRTLFPDGLHFSPVRVGRRWPGGSEAPRACFRLRCDPTGNHLEPHPRATGGDLRPPRGLKQLAAVPVLRCAACFPRRGVAGLFVLLAATACDGGASSPPLPGDALLADKPDGAPPPADAAPDSRHGVAIEVFEPDAARMCVAAVPLDLDPSPGLQPDCWATQRFPTGPNTFHEVTLPDCGRGFVPCWKLVTDETCAVSGLRLEVDRAAAPHPGSRVAIYCRVS